jgi:hypothetical protein
MIAASLRNLLSPDATPSLLRMWVAGNEYGLESREVIRCRRSRRFLQLSDAVFTPSTSVSGLRRLRLGRGGDGGDFLSGKVMTASLSRGPNSVKPKNASLDVGTIAASTSILVMPRGGGMDFPPDNGGDGNGEEIFRGGGGNLVNFREGVLSPDSCNIMRSSPLVGFDDSSERRSLIAGTCAAARKRAAPRSTRCWSW